MISGMKSSPRPTFMLMLTPKCFTMAWENVSMVKIIRNLNTILFFLANKVVLFEHDLKERFMVNKWETFFLMIMTVPIMGHVVILPLMFDISGRDGWISVI